MHSYPTSFAGVNTALHELYPQIKAILGEKFVGMYVIGSLALNGFDPHTSDIDFAVVSNADFDDMLFEELREMHAHFDASTKPWAKRIEAVYVPQHVLRDNTNLARFPQLEHGRELVCEPLEPGWIFQAHTLREYGLVVAGPEPRAFVGSASLAVMRAAVATIAGSWLEQAQHDLEWLAWLQEPENHQFVVLTLCRMLYSLESGDVASKPAAAAWASRRLGHPWNLAIARSLGVQGEQLPQHEVAATIELIRLTSQYSAESSAQ